MTVSGEGQAIPSTHRIFQLYFINYKNNYDAEKSNKKYFLCIDLVVKGNFYLTEKDSTVMRY